MSQNGKGSVPRPFAISKTSFEERWEQTFKRQSEEQAVLDEPSKERSDKQQKRPSQSR